MAGTDSMDTMICWTSGRKTHQSHFNLTTVSNWHTYTISQHPKRHTPHTHSSTMQLLFLLTRTSELHCISTDTMSIFDSAGSRGNSTICRPTAVRPPVLSRAPSIHSWYMELRMLSWMEEEKDTDTYCTETKPLIWLTIVSMIAYTVHQWLIHC